MSDVKHYTDDSPLTLCTVDDCATRQAFPDPTTVDEWAYCDDHEQWWQPEEVVPETEESMATYEDGEKPEFETELEWMRTSDVPARIKVKATKA